MGGNAIPNVTRLAKDPYSKVTQSVLSMLAEWYPENRCSDILSYTNKETFGDLDVIIEQYDNEVSSTLLNNLKEKFDLDKNDYYNNGSVLSFRYPLGDRNITGFQVDIIVEPTKTYEMARDYFAYNDLGNLLGRITKKLGFKLGHKGLSYIVRDGNYKIKEIFFSHYWDTALGLLELDIGRYDEGFDSLEDIFEFVASSPYFNPDIFLLHNRNHNARVRDQKRSTYNKFLKWCEENNESLTHYPYQSERDHYGYGSPSNMNMPFLENVLFPAFPELKEEIVSLRDYLELNKKAKEKYNGELVMRLTGLGGKELGQFMGLVSNKFESKIDMVKWIVETPQADINLLVLVQFVENKKHFTEDF